MTNKTHEGLPVAGYRPQSEEAVRLVNEFKADEERLLRKLDFMQQAADAARMASFPGRHRESRRMTSAETKLAKYVRWKARKPYSDRLTTLYWRYSHQVHGDLNGTGAW